VQGHLYHGVKQDFHIITGLPIATTCRILQ
jgi:hypothetical protein